MEENGDYRVEEYYEGDGELRYVYLPNVDATIFVAGALPRAVPGMVARLPITLATLMAALGLRHLSVGAAAALVLSVVASVARGDRRGGGMGRRGTVEGGSAEVWGRPRRGRRGSGRVRRRGGMHHAPAGQWRGHAVFGP